MKTPREILLGRHKDAGASLDQIRHGIVDRIAAPRMSIAAKLWQGLIVPVRHAWMSLGAAWVVVVVLHIMAGGDAPVSVAKSGPVNPDSVIALQRKEQLMARLAENDKETSLPAEAPERRPRSEVRVQYNVV